MKVDGSDAKEKGKGIERSPVQALKSLLSSDYVKTRFEEVLGQKAPSFIASILTAVQKNPELVKCDNNSVLSAAMVAATLDLPIDSNLGFAAIVPYNTKIVDRTTKQERWATIAQFQIMYKGFIQLALRSDQYKTINVTPIYEDELKSFDILTGEIFLTPVEGGFRELENLDKIVGYTAYFRLKNGFERTEYWPLSKLKAHGERHSKSFKNANSLWKKDPHAMYSKTVLKNTLSKWGILSVTMQNAIASDQGSLKDWRKPIESDNVTYADSTASAEDVVPVEVVEDVQQEQSPPANEAKGNGNSNPAKAESTSSGAEAQEGVAPTKAETSGSSTGLFPKDEADALEEQYKQEQSGHYPDFS
jgi:recombination protein RecT